MQEVTWSTSAIRLEYPSPLRQHRMPDLLGKDSERNVEALN